MAKNPENMLKILNLPLYRPRIVLKYGIWHLEIMSMFSHVKPCFSTSGTGQLPLNNMDRAQNLLHFNSNINTFLSISDISYFWNLLGWFYTIKLSYYIFKIPNMWVRIKQHLYHNNLWIWRAHSPLTSGHNVLPVHRWWWQRRGASLIAIGEWVKAPTRGAEWPAMMLAYCPDGHGGHSLCLKPTRTRHSLDLMSPSTQPRIFCFISEFHTISVAKYEYNMGNSEPCTNIVSSLISNTRIITCASDSRM